MNTEQKPAIAFIGTGMMGQLAHLGNYARLRDAGECEIAGITDLKPQLAEAVAAKYGVSRVYESAEELLRDPTVDAVACIQQWPNNYALAKQVLQAGKSLITEKPMVGRLDEAEELTALAREKGVLYAVGFMKRYDPGVKLARELVGELRAGGEFGALLSVDALCNGGDWLHNIEAAVQVDDPVPLPPLQPTYPDGCRTAQQHVAYGWLLNIFSHNINLCHYLLGGEMEPTHAVFSGDRAMNASLRCGQVMVSVRGAVSQAHEWREWTTLTFERGEIQIKTPTPMNRQRSAEVTVVRQDDRGRWTTTQYHAPVGWAFYLQARGFVRALAGGEPLRAPAEECVWDVRVMQRLIEMAEVL
jgi:predicted dehydrogenase